jgi:hypothetical protein
MANTYSDLTGSTVAANYQKFSPTTQMGTRALRFVTITFGTGGDSDIDLTRGYWNDAGSAYAGTYTDSTSYFAKAVRTVETFFEVWAVGTPSSTAFTVIVSDDTAQDNLGIGQPAGTASAATYADCEAAVAAAMGIGNKAGGATNYNGTVVCASVALVGAALA